MCKVSVIVPVYNNEKYLRACLESLAAQTMKEMEIVVVDDGSTDGSLAIAREFERCAAPRFRVFSTENHGVSRARNYGAEQAAGDYFAFVDGDDEVEPEYCQAMYEKAVQDGNDVVMCRVEHIRLVDGREKRVTYPRTFWEEDNFRLADTPELVSRMSTGPWNKLVSRELFFKAPFPDDICHQEDQLFVMRIFYLAENIGTVKRILYHHYRTHGGVTSTLNPNLEDWLRCMELFVQFMEDYALPDTFRSPLEYLLICATKSNQKAVVAKNDPLWRMRMRLVRGSYAFFRKNFPHWRSNPYYLEKRKRAEMEKRLYFDYGEVHMLALILASRVLPRWLYEGVLIRVDCQLFKIWRHLRWSRSVHDSPGT